jgi:GT2 family glycosyltransferase
MKKKSLSVSIVIPNWNGATLLQKHLPHVILASEGAEIIVVDDCSSDNSLEVLKSKFPTVRVIAKQTNSGFAQTVNVGVAKAKGDIVVLLNSDVVPEKGFLTPLLSHFSDASVFAVGCLEKNPEKHGIVLRGRGIARWQKGFYIHARGEVDASDTAWVSGGSAAFRTSMWKKLGGMDTIFNPFYWEDIDLSYRAMKAGFKVVFERKSEVWHYHQQGAIKTSFQQEKVTRIVFRNQFLFIWKNLSDPSLWMSHMFWAPIRILQELLRGRSAMGIGFVRALLLLPRVVSIRKKNASFWVKRDLEIAVY